MLLQRPYVGKSLVNSKVLLSFGVDLGSEVVSIMKTGFDFSSVTLLNAAHFCRICYTVFTFITMHFNVTVLHF